ncbi:diguanylate cyclase [Rhizobium sp. FKL33]|uniref:diguanylate cyclase n=1 Tax=Rhizobium sp. FKL33 TaxID=2562307 RepID=UPI0010C12AE1|nr:diguanylate cyclase [Rhizobium sp. FKL33]
MDPANSKSAPTNSPKVLLVEDSPALSRLLRQEIINKVECDIVECRLLHEAISEITKGEITVAVTGLNLPDAPDGEILNVLARYGTPTILFSASFVPDLMLNYASRQLVDYIVKDDITSSARVASAVSRVISNGSTSILVVDDMMAVRSDLVAFLQRQNFAVYAAKTGAEALQILEQNREIEIVVTDHFMPDIDGFELTKRIRSRHGSDRLRIIGVSASTDRHLSASFLKAGASDFVYRPFLPEELQCRIDNNVETLRQLKRLRYVAERDPLTSLFNRRAFFERANKYMQTIEAQPHYGAISIIDIDHFKSINDAFGHDAGDEVLKSIGKILLDIAYEENLIASRLGGEEFAVLIKSKGDNEALTIVNKIVDEIRKTEFSGSLSEIKITASAGFVEINRHDELCKQLNRADHMLYRAKRLGRDRICTSLVSDDIEQTL